MDHHVTQTRFGEAGQVLHDRVFHILDQPVIKHLTARVGDRDSRFPWKPAISIVPGVGFPRGVIHPRTGKDQNASAFTEELINPCRLRGIHR